MSGIKEITAKIVDDANEKKMDIINMAKNDAKDILEHAKKEALAEKEKVDARANLEEAVKCERIISKAHSQGKKLVLSKKQELLTKVFENAYQNMLTLDDEAYEKLLLHLVVKYACGNEKVILPKNGKTTVSFIAKANQALLDKGQKGSLELAAETRDFEGGFILVTDEIEINCSLSDLLSEKHDELVGQVSNMLF